MRPRALLDRWNAFLFEPQSPTPIAVYRILFGLLTIANLLAMHRDWMVWFGTHAAVTLATTKLMASVFFPLGPPRVGILDFWPRTDAGVTAVFWVSLVAACCLTIGLWSRVSSIVVYLCLFAIQARNPFIFHAGDQLLRVTGFFLMFAPTGAALSVDRLIRIRRGREGLLVAPRSPWAQRMIQIQVAVMYIATVGWKLRGRTWVGGTALYFALHMTEFHRFPVPGIESPLLIGLGTWGTLLLEAAAGTLIWFRKLRYPVLAAVVALHLGIEYSMNIPFFEWTAIATLVTFVYPEDLARAGSWVRRHMGVRVDALVPRLTPHGSQPVASEGRPT